MKNQVKKCNCPIEDFGVWGQVIFHNHPRHGRWNFLHFIYNFRNWRARKQVEKIEIAEGMTRGL